MEQPWFLVIILSLSRTDAQSRNNITLMANVPTPRASSPARERTVPRQLNTQIFFHGPRKESARRRWHEDVEKRRWRPHNSERRRSFSDGRPKMFWCTEISARETNSAEFAQGNISAGHTHASSSCLQRARDAVVGGHRADFFPDVMREVTHVKARVDHS